jgi:F-type H+-transporting ATPase subunit gamma
MDDVAARMTADRAASGGPLHPLLKENTSNRIGLLLVTADKGLCGSFNTNLIRRAAEFIREHRDKEIRLYIVGRKGRDFFRRLGYAFSGEYVHISNQISYTHAEIIGKDLIDAYEKDELSEVVVIYNEFKSLIQQKLVQERLLPIHHADSPPAGKTDYLFDPPKERLLGVLLPRYVKSQIFRILLESFASELGARMSAMDSATKNAKEIIDTLTLRLNRTRQAIITREIAELVGGAEALK